MTLRALAQFGVKLRIEQFSIWNWNSMKAYLCTCHGSIASRFTSWMKQQLRVLLQAAAWHLGWFCTLDDAVAKFPLELGLA
jgi:hypothetical protein